MNRLALGLGLFVLYGIDDAAGLFRVSVRAGEGDGAAELYSAETDDEATVDAMIAAVVAIRSDALAAAVSADAASAGPQEPAQLDDGGLRSPARRVVPEGALPSRYDLLPGKPRPVLRWRGWGVQAIYGEGGTLPPQTITTAFQVLLATSENIGKPDSVFSKGEVTESGGRVTLDLFARTTPETGGGFDPFAESFVGRMERAVQSDLDAVGFGRQSFAVFLAPPASRVAEDLSSERRVVGSDSTRSGRYFIAECRLGMTFRALGVDYLFSVALLERMAFDRAIEYQGGFAVQTVEDYLTRNRAPASIPEWVRPGSGAVARDIPVLFTSEHKLMRVDIDNAVRAEAPKAVASAPVAAAVAADQAKADLYPDLMAALSGDGYKTSGLSVFVRQSGEALLVYTVDRIFSDIEGAAGKRRGAKAQAELLTFRDALGGGRLVHSARGISADTVQAMLGDAHSAYHERRKGRAYGERARVLELVEKALADGKFAPFSVEQKDGVTATLTLVAPLRLARGEELDDELVSFARRNKVEHPELGSIWINREGGAEEINKDYARLANRGAWFGATGSARTVGATILPLIAKELGRKSFPYAVDKLTRHRLGDAPGKTDFVMVNGYAGVRRDLAPPPVVAALTEAFHAYRRSARIGSSDVVDGSPFESFEFGKPVSELLTLTAESEPERLACVVMLSVQKGESPVVVLRVSQGNTEESFVAADATVVAWVAATVGGAHRLTAQVLRENKHTLLRFWRDEAQSDLAGIAYLAFKPIPSEFKADDAASCLSYQLSPLGVEKIKAEAKAVSASGLSIELGDRAHYDPRGMTDGGLPAFSTLKTEIAPFIAELMALCRASDDVKTRKGWDSPTLVMSVGHSFATLTAVVPMGSGSVGARRVIRVDRQTHGSVAVSLKTFSELLANDASKVVSFVTAQTDRGLVLRMEGGRSGEIDAKPAKVTDGELREVYTKRMKEVTALSWDDADTVEAASHAMSWDDTRPHLAALNITSGMKEVNETAKHKSWPADRVYYVSTDGHRMALGWSRGPSSAKPFELCVRRDAVPLLLSLVRTGQTTGKMTWIEGTEGDLGVGIDDGGLASTREPDGVWRPELWIARHGAEFVWGQGGLRQPSWWQVVPSQNQLKQRYLFPVWRETVRDADAVISLYGSCALVLAPGEKKGEARFSADVEGKERAEKKKKGSEVSADGALSAPIRSMGEVMRVGVEARYLRDAVSSVGGLSGGGVAVYVTGELDPMVITDGMNDGRLLCVVMARRL